MSTEVRIALANIDSTSVLHKISENHEGSLHGATLQDSGLDRGLRHVGGGGVRLDLVSLPGIAVHASLAARGNIAISALVGPAVEGHEAIVSNPPPSRLKKTTVAAKLEPVVTGDKRLGGKNNIDSAVALDTKAIREGLAHTKGPARSAI
jgi:hypothetical protein